MLIIIVLLCSNMHKWYNLYNLEALFKQYLLAGNTKVVSIKNYLSDFRHFAGWFTSFVLNSPHNDTISLLTPNLINQYKNYLQTNNLPPKTINRRLSTLRKFCSFCISQGWLKENPAKKIINIVIDKPVLATQNEILSQFKSDLVNQGLDTQTINSSLDTIRELFSL